MKIISQQPSTVNIGNPGGISVSGSRWQQQPTSPTSHHAVLSLANIHGQSSSPSLSQLPGARGKASVSRQGKCFNLPHLFAKKQPKTTADHIATAERGADVSMEVQLSDQRKKGFVSRLGQAMGLKKGSSAPKASVLNTPINGEPPNSLRRLLQAELQQEGRQSEATRREKGQWSEEGAHDYCRTELHATAGMRKRDEENGKLFGTAELDAELNAILHAGQFGPNQSGAGTVFHRQSQSADDSGVDLDIEWFGLASVDADVRALSHQQSQTEDSSMDLDNEWFSLASVDADVRALTGGQPPQTEDIATVAQDTKAANALFEDDDINAMLRDMQHRHRLGRPTPAHNQFQPTLTTIREGDESVTSSLRRGGPTLAELFAAESQQSQPTRLAATTTEPLFVDDAELNAMLRGMQLHHRLDHPTPTQGRLQPAAIKENQPLQPQHDQDQRPQKIRAGSRFMERLTRNRRR